MKRNRLILPLLALAAATSAPAVELSAANCQAAGGPSMACYLAAQNWGGERCVDIGKMWYSVFQRVSPRRYTMTLSGPPGSGHPPESAPGLPVLPAILKTKTSKLMSGGPLGSVKAEWKGVEKMLAADGFEKHYDVWEECK